MPKTLSSLSRVTTTTCRVSPIQRPRLWLCRRHISTSSSTCSTVVVPNTASTVSALEPPPAGGHMPSIASSALLKHTREQALKMPEIVWADAELDEARGTSSLSSTTTGRETRKMNTYQAIRDALSIALSTDDSAIVFGEDVAFGGVFRCTLGLAEEYGRERVFNTPLTEQGVVGFGIGYASMGSKLGNSTLGGRGMGGTAIAEVQFADYIWPAFDQLLNEASKFRYRSGGQFNVGGLTVRCPTMAVGHGGLYHSQSPEGFFMGAGGLKVVIPRSPLQAKGLLLSSIRDPNPVIFMEPKVLYRSAVEQVPTSDYILPLGRAEILTPGSDLTVVTYGTSVYRCEQAIHLLTHPPEGTGIERTVRDALGDWRRTRRGQNTPSAPTIELIDLCTILPYDLPLVLRSLSKTHRLLIVHEGPTTGGVGMQIAGDVMSGFNTTSTTNESEEDVGRMRREAFLGLEAPVKVIGGWDTPGVALQYEKFYIPDEVRILDGLLEVLAY
ncbi:thiamine diphosphate-binding protein [Lentinula lateritia]|uniref:3-methyl-2-oxobutanoate dehydrogenase (2-methylpropanoyl-transferring) n=1 Tax=Lentinula lateritia TaxID=40482 RepID=A0ABQ8VLS4_9AGAR|nr:thiamine diphosphate-binding protein [Lentinula lateritia]